ncbi:MAG: S8 family serine peptidase [Planctomycetota bacterium]
MIQPPRKTLVSRLTVCVVVLFVSAGIVAGADGLQSDYSLQPQGLEHTGIYALRQIDPTLTGAGVKFAVICRSFTYLDGKPQNDYRPAIGHDCFKNSRFSFHEEAELPLGVSPHSTAICSILLGEDPCAFHPDIGQFYYQGTSPQAQANIYEFEQFLINNVFAHVPPDADIITAAWGSQFEDWWTRGIEALAEHHGIIIVAGIGNGADAYDPVLYPGAGANVIGVGVVDSVNSEDPVTNLANFALAYPEHSSLGPTSNGRCKPDIVAPGNCLAAKANEPNHYEATGDWSSFSTPVVAGTIGLLVQKAKQDPDLSLAVSPDGGNCVIKAILLNSATKLPYWHKGQLQTDDDHSAPLDYIQGAGMLNALGAYEHLTAGLNRPGEVPTTGWDLNLLNKSEAPENTYKITLKEPADKSITVTAVWNRHYDRAYPFARMPKKDSNLRLELRAVDPANSNNYYSLDHSDSSVDNVEHIHVSAHAEYTDYEIVLSFSDIDDQEEPDVTQRYGLAWNVSNKQEPDSIFWYDLNADGIVNELDFAIVLNNRSSSSESPESYLIGDIHPDGAIDANDLTDLLGHYTRQADWHAGQEGKSE